MKKVSALLIIFTMLFVVNIARADAVLKTPAVNEIGLSFGYYGYQEPGVMTLRGAKIGLELRTTRELVSGPFIRGDLRYAFGTVDYTSDGSGSADGLQDWYLEARGLIGKAIPFNHSVYALYTGLGYRHLFNDARGISSTGFAGYRRESTYFYLPIGVIHRSLLNDQARLVSTLEYDRLLSGKQVSRLNDAGLGYEDISNDQSRGYGLKLSVIYERDDWALGPYFYYWNIDQSDTSLLYQNGVPVGIGWEPKNDTVEFGLKASQQF